MNDETKKSRRKFLGTGAAAPFIMTVQSGSVLAASSSLCKQVCADAPVPDLLPTATSDLWLRRTEKVYSIDVGGVAQGLYIESFTKATGSPYIRIDSGVPADSTFLKDGVGFNVTDTGTTREALVQIDAAGNIVGFQWQTSLGGQKITKSCYTSFKP